VYRLVLGEVKYDVRGQVAAHLPTADSNPAGAPAGGTTFDTHLWLDADSAAGRALAESAQITAADLRAVITGHQVLRRATTRSTVPRLRYEHRAAAG